jgi:carboxymethylenebutenolidase
MRVSTGVMAALIGAFVSTGYGLAAIPNSDDATGQNGGQSIARARGVRDGRQLIAARQGNVPQAPQSAADGKSWFRDAAPGVRDLNLPPDEDAAKGQLAGSPRRHESVDVKLQNASAIKSFVVYPQFTVLRPTAGVVIVIHENSGLTDWVRGVADQLAYHGFIAIAPDLLSGKGLNGGGTDSLTGQVEQVIGTLTVDDVVSRLNAVREYGLKIPTANGRVAALGFSWGGGMSLHYALNQPALNGAASFYGPIPANPAAYANRSQVPVLGLYAQTDATVNENIPLARIALGPSFSPNMYFDASHGFVRQQNGQNGANLKATAWAWGETIDFLRRVAGGGGA